MTTLFKYSFFFILAICGGTNTFSQTKNFAAQEERLVKLYAKMESFLRVSYDSLPLYSEKFDKELTRFIQNNPGTLKYPFKKFEDDHVCDVVTSGDGNFRIYTWDTQTGGTMHFYHEILQWNSNGKVFTKIIKYEKDDPGSFCSAVYTAQVNNKPVYLAVKNGVYSTKDVMQSVTAFRINGKLLDSVKLFRTKTERLNTIQVYFDFFSVVGRPERPLKLITYDDEPGQLYIPVVGDKDQVTKKNLVYQLKGSYFEYTGVEAGTAQNKKLAAQEDKLAKLYSRLMSFIHAPNDSVEVYSEKFEKELKDFLQRNPGTLNYLFKKLDRDSGFCSIQTSADGKFRIYSWDTWTGGSLHYYKEVYQWRGANNVFLRVPRYEGGTDGDGLICSNMFTVIINKKAYYLAVKNSVTSNSDRGYSISAYRIDGDKLLDSVKLFKTKTEMLNTIDVSVDLSKIVEPYERDDEFISYDPRLKIVYIPFVNEKNELTNKNLLYQLKGRYFEYIGIETGRRRSTR